MSCPEHFRVCVSAAALYKRLGELHSFLSAPIQARVRGSWVCVLAVNKTLGDGGR